MTNRRRFQTTTIGLAALAVLSLASCRSLPGINGNGQASQGPGTETHTLTSGGMSRTYIEHIPANHPDHPALVVILHGADSTAAGVESNTNFDHWSDKDGFIAVYPQGFDNGWADGRGVDPSDRAHIDDVGFLAKVVGEVEGRDHADPKRVFFTGISNGGFMAERFACDRADLVSAIAPVASSIGTSVNAGCHPSMPVSVMDIHGTADPLVPFSGGAMSGRGGISHIISADQVFADWSRRDGCHGSPHSHSGPHRTNDGTSVEITVATGCPSGVAVQEWKIIGGGHSWPGLPQNLPVRFIGVVSQQFSAPAKIWDFLTHHGR